MFVTNVIFIIYHYITKLLTITIYLKSLTIMIKTLKLKTVNSDIENRMKEFEKIRTKFRADLKKAEAKSKATAKEGKGILKSISNFFSDTPKASPKATAKK